MAEEHIVEGRAALRRGDWTGARKSFEAAVADDPSGDAYEGLAWSAWWLDDTETLYAARERAYRRFRRAGDLRGAARSAIWLASDHLDFRGELAVANGWRARARRLLDDLPECIEHAWLLLHEGALVLELEEDVAGAQRRAHEAAAIGRRMAAVDVEMLGIAMEGLALVTQGAVAEGISMLDEAVAAALGGEFDELAGVGWTCCYLIYACERIRDYDRAAEWCLRVEEFTHRLGIPFLLRVCRAHYAGVLVWRGEWADAEAELSAATEALDATRPVQGVEGHVRLGDLRRRQGRPDDAKAEFSQAADHPLAVLGLAELALENGDPLGARDLAEQALRALPAVARTQRSPFLEVAVRAHVAVGDRAAADVALAELREIAGRVPTRPLLGSTAFAEGVAGVARGDYEAARRSFEDAVSHFRASSAPFETATAHLELAHVLAALGRPDASHANARAAHDLAQRLGARRVVDRAGALLPAERRGPLSPRELEVLRRIAAGGADRAVAAELHLSEHTVHRHVANLMSKLGCTSRAAAVAEAARRGLL